MLFNSIPFVFGFLPLVLAGFYTLGHWRRDWAILWLILASLCFYAWWRPLNVLLITPSILVNYVLARIILRRVDDRPAIARIALLTGILFNLCFLGYFKYINFLGVVAGDVFGVNMVFTNVILPLGISFITFQKIAFLIDVNSGRVTSFTLKDYALFVLFFPQLVAGPIVHYREMMPQFHAAPCRFRADDMAIGIVLFSFGLFKKTVLADSIAIYVSPLYADAARGAQITLFHGWIAAIGFMLQVYYDFAGYSEMALGLARFFGVKLPVNFYSPLKAPSIIEFWQHWHMTLTRFLTAYLYNPMTLSLTRRRMARGARASSASSSPAAFITLIAFPTIVTFAICGIWHGAGYTYIIWGFIHGALLSINQAWRALRRAYLPQWKTVGVPLRLVGRALTFISVVTAIVVFRAPTVGAAVAIWQGMIGINGATMPQAYFDHAGSLAAALQMAHVRPDPSSGASFIAAWVWIVGLLAIAWIMPNVLQMLRNYEPALGISAKPPPGEKPNLWLSWQPSTAWSVSMAVLAAAGILSLGQLSEFLYWQF